jgi:hypothetical protein
MDTTSSDGAQNPSEQHSETNDKTFSKTKPTISSEKILIQGVTEEGESFRPSDWAERMSGTLATFQKHRIYYSPQLQPIMKDGHKCVVLDPALKESNPALYQSILDFAQSNKLRICNEDDNLGNL